MHKVKFTMDSWSDGHPNERTTIAFNFEPEAVATGMLEHQLDLVIRQFREQLAVLAAGDCAGGVRRITGLPPSHQKGKKFR